MSNLRAAARDWGNENLFMNPERDMPCTYNTSDAPVDIDDLIKAITAPREMVFQNGYKFLLGLSKYLLEQLCDQTNVDSHITCMEIVATGISNMRLVVNDLMERTEPIKVGKKKNGTPVAEAMDKGTAVGKGIVRSCYIMRPEKKLLRATYSISVIVEAIIKWAKIYKIKNITTPANLWGAIQKSWPRFLEEARRMQSLLYPKKIGYTSKAKANPVPNELRIFALKGAGLSNNEAKNASKLLGPVHSIRKIYYLHSKIKSLGSGRGNTAATALLERKWSNVFSDLINRFPAEPQKCLLRHMRDNKDQALKTANWNRLLVSGLVIKPKMKTKFALPCGFWSWRDLTSEAKLSGEHLFQVYNEWTNHYECSLLLPNIFLLMYVYDCPGENLNVMAWMSGWKFEVISRKDEHIGLILDFTKNMHRVPKIKEIVNGATVEKDRQIFLWRCKPLDHYAPPLKGSPLGNQGTRSQVTLDAFRIQRSIPDKVVSMELLEVASTSTNINDILLDLSKATNSVRDNIATMRTVGVTSVLNKDGVMINVPNFPDLALFYSQ